MTRRFSHLFTILAAELDRIQISFLFVTWKMFRVIYGNRSQISLAVLQGIPACCEYYLVYAERWADFLPPTTHTR